MVKYSLWFFSFADPSRSARNHLLPSHSECHWLGFHGSWRNSHSTHLLSSQEQRMPGLSTPTWLPCSRTHSPMAWKWLPYWLLPCLCSKVTFGQSVPHHISHSVSFPTLHTSWTHTLGTILDVLQKGWSFVPGVHYSIYSQCLPQSRCLKKKNELYWRQIHTNIHFPRNNQCGSC